MIQRHEWRWIAKPAIFSGIGTFVVVMLALGLLGSYIEPALVKAGVAFVVVPVVVSAVILSRKRAAVRNGTLALEGGAAIPDAKGSPSSQA